MTVSVVLGIVLFVVSLALRGATANRHVRRRLTVSCALFAACAIAAFASGMASLSPQLREQLITALPLLLGLGIVNALVVILVNPWRADRVPDQFPSIVQDAIIIAVFAAFATLVLQERILAVAAAGAVIIGLALQDTLGNLFSGLAIQVEQPFQVGHWVTIGGTEGRVAEVTWRATKIRTLAGNFVIVPNSTLAKDVIVNFSEPTPETAIDIEVGAAYEAPPNDVKQVIRTALADEPLLARDRSPEIMVKDFGASAIVYRVRVWTRDFGEAEHVRDHVRSHIYYAFRRANIVIPYPIQVQIDQPPPGPAAVSDAKDLLGSIDIFASLSDGQRSDLLEDSRRALYESGEVIVREGNAGSSMFVLARGEASVRVSGADGEVAHVRSGGYFGEMSLLTGDLRGATVVAVSDCDVVEISADAFRRVVLADPVLLERVAAAVTSRQRELESHRAANAARPKPIEEPLTFLTRARRFLRLASPSPVSRA